MKRVRLLICVMATIFTGNVSAQSVTVNTDGTAANPSAVLDVKSTVKGFLPPRMTTVQRDAISLPAAGLLIYNLTDNVVEYFNGTVWTNWSATAHFIGENYGGGIIFYIYDNGRHGLIAATADQNGSGGNNVRWWAGTSTNTAAYGGSTPDVTGIGAGKSNTEIIISNQGMGDGSTYAARVCHEYSVTVGAVTYQDWYLPSLKELNLLYQQKAVVGGFIGGYYWSSSESGISTAWGQGFGSSFTQFGGFGKISTLYMRPISSF